MLTLDWLHDLSLGVAQDLLKEILHELIHANVYLIPIGAAENMMEMSLLRVQADLERWYADERATGRNITEIQKMEKGMFGTYTSQSFGLKAAETNYFLEFTITLLDRRARALPQ